MKINLFKVREKKEKKIIIEEEKYKNPLIIFLLRHKSFLLMSIGLLLICILLISIGLAFSLFGSSTDFDITYIEGDEIIEPNTDPSVKEEDVMEELLGVGTEGVVVLVKRFMTNKGDIIMYYSDGTAIKVAADGDIFKVFPTSSGSYGVDLDGNFVEGSIKGKVSSRTETLEDNTIITYYSDGSAQVEHNNIIVYVRDSDNIESDNVSFNEIIPSGIGLESKHTNNSVVEVVEFSDGTYMIISNGNKYIVNKKTNVVVSDSTVSYDKQNTFAVILEKELNDSSKIVYFEDGSAVISDSNGKNIYVNKSGDIVIKDNKVYEIITNEKGNSVYNKRCPNGSVVTYYDNGAAVVTNSKGEKSYVEDSNSIIYDSNGNIATIGEEVSNVISSGKMVTGEKVSNFSNGKSEVINKDGTSYIIDSSEIKLVEEEEEEIIIVEPEEEEEPPVEEEEEGGESDGPKVDTSGIYISDAEHTHNDFKNIQTTSFVIKNKNNSPREFRIVIEEVNDYSAYNSSRLEPNFVMFQAVIGGDYIAPTKLDNNVWTDSDGSVNYVIFDGTVNAKSSMSIDLSLYIDYAELDNSYQDKWFIGTIKVYLITPDE